MRTVLASIVAKHRRAVCLGIFVLAAAILLRWYPIALNPNFAVGLGSFGWFIPIPLTGQETGTGLLSSELLKQRPGGHARKC
jgi:hypothetical protein